MKFNYKKLQSYIKESLPAVEVLREKIIFHAFEVESVEDLGGGDYELEIKVLPDRAFDAKDERGMAREIAALFKLNLIEPDHYNRSDKFDFTAEQVSKLLGRTITNEEIEAVFDAYDYQYTYSESNGFLWTLFIPPWRKDLYTIHDICDELGRYLGYDTIPAVLPDLPKTVQHDPEFQLITAKKQEMIQKGYHEVMTYSLTKKGDYQVAKGPKGKDFLRTNLLDGLRAAYVVNKQNEAMLPNATSAIFELGKVFLKSGEELHIAWIDAKGEHEEAITVSQYSELSSAELPSLELLNRSAQPVATSRFAMWSEFPFMTRDVALWVPEHTSPTDIAGLIKNTAGPLCVNEPRLFDQFTKDGRTSYGFRLIFQAHDRTLTEEELTPIMSTVYAALATRGYEIR